MICSNVDRIHAEEDIRKLMLHCTVEATGEARQEYYEQLKRQVGTIVVKEERLDSAGLSRLKAMNKAI